MIIICVFSSNGSQCAEFNFDDSVFRTTVVTEFNLVRVIHREARIQFLPLSRVLLDDPTPPVLFSFYFENKYESVFLTLSQVRLSKD